ncbi:MAG: DUF3570 domain-containing protein [Nannocystaceae bacterium]
MTFRCDGPALGATWSTGAAYRYYSDSWKIKSHTGSVDMSVAVTSDSLISLSYRGYTQNAAFFYLPSYDTLEGSRYVTHDRELSRMNSHQLGLRGEYVSTVGVGSSALTLGALVAETRYHYPDFLALDRVWASEFGLTLGLSY